MNRRFPLQVRTDTDGSIVRINIVNQWYDDLEPIYRRFQQGKGLAAIEYDRIRELVESFYVEVGLFGITISLSVLYALKWAAERHIEIGRVALIKASAAAVGTGSGSISVTISE